MTNTQAAKILADFNRWRRNKPPYDKGVPSFCKYTGVDIGLALDLAVKALKK